MRKNRSARTIPVLAVTLLLGLVTPVAGATAKAPNRLAEGWCGTSTASDWLCRWRGGASLNAVPLSSRVPLQLGRNSRVAAGAGSAARIALRGQAQCTVGTGKRTSEVVTRPGPGVLLRQLSGDTSCGTSRRSGIELCTALGCNTELEAEGVMIASILPEETATASAVTSEETTHHRVRIVSCSGFVSVITPNGSASGGATGANRYVVEVDEYTSTTTTTSSSASGGTGESRVETPTGVIVVIAEGGSASTSTSSGTSIVQNAELPGRGPCRAKYVSEEESELRP